MIFKTINSSVDETRKTLALFNKDWGTYKRNWQNANGVFGKIGSVFTPANAITKSDIEAIKAYNSQIDSCVTSQTAFNRTMLNASPAAQNLVASYNGGKVSAQGMATAQNAAKASTIGLTIAQTALNAAIGMGIGLLISLVVKGIDKLVHANEEAIEKAEELRRKYEEFKSTNESNISTLKGLKKEFEELSKGVSQYGDNISLTTEQYERYKEIIQQIVGMSPSLTEGYSTENGYIADKNGLLERAIELQEQEHRNELRKITNLDNLKTSMSGYIAKYKEAFNGGLVTDDMSATVTREFTNLKKAIYEIFNTNNRSDFSSEDMIRQIMSSIGIEDIEAEMAKYYNEYGSFQSQDFWKEYADIIAKNIEVITNSLSSDIVGLDDTVFDQNKEKVDSAAQSYLDMKDAISMANESIQRDLGYIAEYADGYSNLSTEQQKFVNEFLKGYDISDIMSESNNPFNQGWKFDEDKMASVKSQITKFVEALSQDETTKTALADLYAIPTDEQSISEFINQFRKSLEVVKAYCQENGIEIPIAITDSEQTINDLEAQYQRAVDFAKDKFEGYDPTTFFKEHSINTQEEIDAWQEIAQGARDAAEAEREYIQGSTLNKNPISSFQEAFDSLDTDIQQKLLDLAKSGEITAETMSSTEEYNTLLSQTGLSAESAKNQILDMLSIQEKLAGAANGLEKLKSSYEEFKDLGFVTAQSIESLPDAFKELEGYDLFSEIVGDPTQGKEAIQQAFNDIVKEYIFSQDTLQGLVDASESQIQSYIANLKEMGVTNAEEVVNTTIRVLNQENELLNAAEKEYMNYLEAKDGYDEEYIKSATSKNSQLVSALGDAYKGDYDNWCNLLSKKAQAYNKFVTSLKSASNTNSSGEPLSAKGQAEKIIRETNNGTKNVYDPSAKKGAGYFQANPKPGDYTKAQVDSAREYLKQYEEINKLKEELKFDLSTIDTNYGFDYSPKGRSDGKSGTDKKDTAKEETTKDFSETFDWIERRIKKFQRAFDKWLKQAETAVTSGFINKYYKKAFSSAKSQLSIYGKAYNRYMAEANAVDLDEKYAKKVRNGTIDLEEIHAHGTEEEVKKYEELAEKIKKYQDYYDKAQDSMNSFAETAEKLYNLPLEKAARKVDIFRDAIDLLGKEIDNETDYTKKNKKIDRQTQKEKKILDANKAASTESKKSLSSAKKELRKNRNLNADDGITKKERTAIRKAAKGNKEVNLSYFKENSAGYKAAVKYNEALKARKKALNDAKSAQQDYDAWEVEASKLKFDNIADHYSKEVQMIGYDMSALDDRISEIEASGRKVYKSYYEDQKKVNAQKLAQYQSEKAALEQSIQNIKKGTDEWYDAYDQIQQVSSSISECTKETYELNDAISQLHFDMVDDTTEGIKRIITEQEFLRGLFAHEKNTDKKTGGLTDAGLANLGSLSAGYNLSKENASRLAAEVAELQRMLDAGETYSSLLGIELNSIDNVEKRLNEARATEQEWVKERYDNASAIHGIMEELYNAELDYLKELVDAKKEALDAEKDLHDYQKTISEKTEGIAAIQKQIAAYSGDTSEEGRAKLQRLQKELDDKKDDLKETEYDRYVSDQKEMLDDLYDEYSKNMEEKLEDFMAIVQEGLDKADDNMSAIRDFLGEVASRNGYEAATKGLFDSKFVLNGSDGTTSNTGIGDNAKDTASQVADREGKRYDPTRQETVQPTDPPFEGNKLTKHESDDVVKSNVKQYIGEAAIKAKEKKKEYSDVSQKVYENKAKSYKGTGKVLSTAAMKGLARLLGVEYDNASKNGRLYKKLKSIKFPGFRKGGVVSVDDIEKQVHENGDDGLVSVKNGEGILNLEQTEMMRKFAEHMPDFMNAYNPGNLVPVANPLENLKAVSNARSMNNVVNIENLALPNVTNYDEFKDRMFHDMQSDKKYIQFINDSSMNRTNGAGRLAKNRIPL